MRRFFCGRCGSPIYSAPDADGLLVFLKSGTLDDVSVLDPKVNIWCDSAWPATRFAEDAMKVARNPPM